MHGGPELTLVLILCAVLGIGALLRVLAKKWKLPYTITLLVLGLAVGLGLEHLSHDTPGVHWLELLRQGGALSPDLIIFIFLPVLVFESAFALDTHAFKKSLGTVLVLAVPVLLLATLSTAALMKGLTGLELAAGWDWSWSAALVFGALISATDPVAVVALLKDLGASRRLGLLIEGESLLNDGTAIVLFGTLLALLTGGAELALGATVVHFFQISGGGLLIGLVLAFLVSLILKRTFNMPMVEITLTLVLAYGAMLVAEGMFHVSGVIAVVAAGLWLSGPARVNISPEVEHFLHRFWEMLAYMANTLIFFLVGLVTARHLAAATWQDGLLVVIIFAGISVIRMLLVLGVRPLLSLVGGGVSPGEATVMAWGGLRGAVALALALIVAQNPAVSPELGRQVLLAATGVALLSILVNGSTMGWLLRKTGLDKPPAPLRLAELKALASGLMGVRDRVDEMAQSRDLLTCNWGEVRESLDRDEGALARQMIAAEKEAGGQGTGSPEQAYWLQALRMEQSAYWQAFSRGVLGGAVTRVLMHEVDLDLDRLAAGDLGLCRPRYGTQGRWRSWLGRLMQRRGKVLNTLQFTALSLRFDLCRASVQASEAVLKGLARAAQEDPGAAAPVVEAYRKLKHLSTEHLEDMRTNLPEVARAIETRLARRIQPNLERDAYRDLARSGALGGTAADQALQDVEARMVKLHQMPRTLTLPGTGDLVREVVLFRDLDPTALETLATHTRERVLAPQEVLFRQGEAGDSMFCIARGAMQVLAQDGEELKLLDVLGGGEIIGEMALLTGGPRNATLRAVTTVTLAEIPRQDFLDMVAGDPRRRREVWAGFAWRSFDNCLRDDGRFAHMSQGDRRDWFRAGELVELEQGQVPAAGSGFLFLVHGTLTGEEGEVGAPALLRLSSGPSPKAAKAGWAVLLPPPFS